MQHARRLRTSHSSIPSQSNYHRLSFTQTIKPLNPSPNVSLSTNDPNTSTYAITSFEITSKRAPSIFNTFQVSNKLPIFSRNPFQASSIKQLCKLYALIRSFSVFNLSNPAQDPGRTRPTHPTNPTNPFINSIKRSYGFSLLHHFRRSYQSRVFPQRQTDVSDPISETWVDAFRRFESMSNRRFQISNHHCRGFSLVLSISFNLVRFVQTSRFTFIIINWRFFSGCKSCRPVVLKRLPSGIFPPHLQIRIRISNRNSCTSSFSKAGMLELEASRRFYF